MSEWSGLFKNAIASLDSKLDQAMGLPEEQSDQPDPTPVKVVEDFDLPETQLAFLEIYQTRFESMASKIKHLVEENVGLIEEHKVNGAAATAKKIDLLMDEGRRLSAQELKLNTTIKRLRAQIATFQQTQQEMSKTSSELEVAEKRHQAQSSAFQSEIATLKAKLGAAQSEVNQCNARIEHYKSMASIPPTNAASTEENVKLKEAIRLHENSRENWQTMETQLLQAVAELESAAETREQHQTSLKERLEKAQKQSSELRQLLDAANETIEGLESRLAAKESSIKAKEDELRQLGEALASAQEHQPKEAANTQEQDSVSDQRSDVSPDQTVRSISRSPSRSPSPPAPFSQVEYEDTAPPPLEALEPDSLSSHVDPEDSFAFTGSINSGTTGDVHLLAKLSQANRKLEAQLLIVKESLAQARAEKDAAYEEMLKHMSISEEYATLKQENTQQQTKQQELQKQFDLLLVKLGQKSEQVDELKADVADLKEMYQQQIQTLIGELESRPK